MKSDDFPSTATPPSSSTSSSNSSRPDLPQQSPFPSLDGSGQRPKSDDDYSVAYGPHNVPGSASDLKSLPPTKPRSVCSLDRPTCLATSSSGLGYRHSLDFGEKHRPRFGRPYSPTEQVQDSDSVEGEISIEHQDMPADEVNSDSCASTGSYHEEQSDGNIEPDPQIITRPDIFRCNGMSGVEGASSYDLRAPPPSAQFSNVEFLSERLFSLDHLNVILGDAHHYVRFNAFLNKYQPQYARSLSRYLKMQKALSSIDYANSVAEELEPGSQAAVLDRNFVTAAGDVVQELVNEALPKYITHMFVIIATEALVKEITRQNTPMMREMVSGLGEVYCLTDPSLPDNPIVYASEEFYRYTQYGRSYSIGRNCRFLQGPKSSSTSVQRIEDALASGTEICETILNYRRDGSPFMNLLMIAPLYDNKGTIRYFIGAQIDVTGLVEQGRGLDSFEQLLAKDRRGSDPSEQSQHLSDSHKALGELSAFFDETDRHEISNGSKKRSHSNVNAPTDVGKGGTTRKLVSMDLEDSASQALWPPSRLGPSGRLPGVFQNYLLVRPYPSLRIIFTSPALRIPGLTQSKLLDRVGGSVRIRKEIIEAMSSGISVTARVNWLPHGVADEFSLSNSKTVSSNGTSKPNNYYRDAFVNDRISKIAGADSTIVGRDGNPGKPRWMHCTPLLGSDDKIGVWMVVLVESEFVTGSLNVSERTAQAAAAKGVSLLQFLHERGLNDTPPPGGSAAVESPAAQSGSNRVSFSKILRRSGQNNKLRPGKLYQDYVKREGAPESPSLISAMDGADELLQDFPEFQDSDSGSEQASMREEPFTESPSPESKPIRDF